GVSHHVFRARRGDNDVSRRSLVLERFALQWIAQVPEVSAGLDLDHLEIGNGGEQLRVPVDQPFVLVDEPLTMKFYKNFKNGPRQALIHREALARPVARCAKALQLVDDGA